MRIYSRQKKLKYVNLSLFWKFGMGCIFFFWLRFFFQNKFESLSNLSFMDFDRRIVSFRNHLTTDE